MLGLRRTCSFVVRTLAFPTVGAATVFKVPRRFDRETFEVVATICFGSGTTGCIVFPYNSIALLTIVIMRLISRYEARMTTGLVTTSMLAICCDELDLVSKENVKSTSSKNRTLSEGCPIRLSDMPSRSTPRASTPCRRSSIENVSHI